MSLFKKQAIGIDLGAYSIKVALLKKQGNEVDIIHLQTFNREDESILNDSEAVRFLNEYLQEKGWQGCDVSVIIPQFLTNAQLADFPTGTDKSLTSLVEYETKQLSGLSDEQFIYDFAQVPPSVHRNNPVFIGMARGSAIEKYVSLFENSSIHLTDLSPGGSALLNGFFQCYPAYRDETVPQILLDIGHEQTNIIVFCAGQPLYCSSFFFGGDKFTQALAGLNSCSSHEAELAKNNSTLELGNPDQILTKVSAEFEAELSHAIDHWRSVENEELAVKVIQNVFMCGDASCLKGWPEHLSRAMGMNFSVLKENNQEGVGNNFLNAYGMALQGLKKGACCISLASDEVREFTTRRHRLPFAVAAAVMLVCLMLWMTYDSYSSAIKTKQKHTQVLEDLKK